jgi:hypothetical protein
MKALILTVLLASSSAMAMDLPTLDFMDSNQATNQALVNYAKNVVGMQGQIKITNKSGLLKTTSTVTEMASGCSFVANVVLKNWGWTVVEKQGSNNCK